MDATFYGQQEGERILYEVRPHSWWRFLTLFKFGVAGFAIALFFWILGASAMVWAPTIRLTGFILAGIIIAVGWWIDFSERTQKVTYITDRRVVRFAAITPWVTNSRSIIWDEVVKVKTTSPNFIWRILNIGMVIVHARSTIIPADGQLSEQMVTNDDIMIEGISYFKDLGNYLDKVLYLYKKDPIGLQTLRGFIPKPTGKRY